MSTGYKNKTLATFVAFTLGSIGAHRFYLNGKKDFWGWVHFLTLPLSLLLIVSQPGKFLFFLSMPLIISAVTAFIETLVIGLTPDEKWDAIYNQTSRKTSNSGWLVAIILVLAMGLGTVITIAAIARTFDLLFTGGAFG